MRDPSQPIPAAAAFDTLSESWDTAHGPRSPRAREVEDRIAYLRAFCMREKPARVLEIGCGTGQNLLGIADLVTLGIGVDVSPEMVARAARNAAELLPAPLRFMTGDALTLSPQELGPFDGVLFIGALEHIQPQTCALRVARALLAPAGRVIVIMPHPWQPRVLLSGPPRVDGRPIATRMLSPRHLGQIAEQADLLVTGLVALTYTGWHSYRKPRLRSSQTLPLGRLGSLCAAMGRAYAVELRKKGSEGGMERP